MLLPKVINPIKAFFRRGPQWLRVLLGAGVIAGLCWFAWQQFGASNDADKAKLAAVKADPRVVCEGIVVPVRYASMSLQVSGVVAELFVQEGEAVKTGQLLARLSSDELQAKAAGAN